MQITSTFSLCCMCRMHQIKEINFCKIRTLLSIVKLQYYRATSAFWRYKSQVIELMTKKKRNVEIFCILWLNPSRLWITRVCVFFPPSSLHWFQRWMLCVKCRIVHRSESWTAVVITKHNTKSESQWTRSVQWNVWDQTTTKKQQ